VRVTIPFDLYDRASWGNAASWFAEFAPKVHRAFSTRLALLPPEVFAVPE
jgi:hypothetical protein